MSSDPGFLFDIPIEVVIELGRTQMTVGEVAALDLDDVIKLDVLAGYPLEVKVNGQLFGRGEVVIDEERVGLRLTELVGQAANAALAEAG